MTMGLTNTSLKSLQVCRVDKLLGGANTATASQACRAISITVAASQVCRATSNTVDASAKFVERLKCCYCFGKFADLVHVFRLPATT
jgi:hypothetical protein